MSEESKKSNQVLDTDAALTNKDRAALTPNPNPNFAKPDPTMGEDEGWNSDEKGDVLGGDQMTTTGNERRTSETDQAGTRPSWQSENMRGWQSGDSLRAENQTSTSNQPSSQGSQAGSQNWQSSGATTSDTVNQAKQTASDVADQTKQTASDVANQAKQAASETVSQVKQTTTEVMSQAKQAVSQSLDEAKRQVQTTFDEQRTQAAGRLGGLANALHKTGENLDTQNEAQFARYAHSAAEQIDNWSNMLQTKNLNELMNEVHDFAHRQPELFIAGSLAAGLLLGRFLKSSGSRTARYNDYNRYGNRNDVNNWNNDRSYGRRTYKHSTEDAISRMDYESPAPQNIKIADTEGDYAR